MPEMTCNLLCQDSVRANQLYKQPVRDDARLLYKAADYVQKDVKLRITHTKFSSLLSSDSTMSFLFLLSPDIRPRQQYGPIEC